LRDEDGFSFIRWLRRSDLEPNRTTPVVVVSANSSSVSIKRARDSGATFYLAKPISPKTLLDRVMWVLRDNRQFVITDTFAGPDRRFRLEGPPPGVAPRRKTDITSRLSQTAESNMSQNEIDSLLKPQKVSL
jgi:DNA-binding response OmpR family regulator